MPGETCLTLMAIAPPSYFLVGDSARICHSCHFKILQLTSMRPPLLKMLFILLLRLFTTYIRRIFRVRLSHRRHWPPSSPVLPLCRRRWTTSSAIFPLYRLLRPAGMCYQVPTLPLVVVFSPFATVHCLPHQAAPGDRLHRGSSDRDLSGRFS